MAENENDTGNPLRPTIDVKKAWEAAAFMWSDPEKHFLQYIGNKGERIAIQETLTPIMEELSTTSGSILDIGSAGVTEVYYPKNLLPRVLAVDISEEALKHSNAGNTRLADIRDGLPDIEDDTFDAVSAFFLFRYLENQEFVMRELLRVLKPGGRFILIDYQDSDHTLQVRKFEPESLKANFTLNQSQDLVTVQLSAGIKSPTRRDRNRIVSDIYLMTGTKPKALNN